MTLERSVLVRQGGSTSAPRSRTSTTPINFLAPKPRRRTASSRVIAWGLYCLSSWLCFCSEHSPLGHIAQAGDTIPAVD